MHRSAPFWRSAAQSPYFRLHYIRSRLIPVLLAAASCMVLVAYGTSCTHGRRAFSGSCDAVPVYPCGSAPRRGVQECAFLWLLFVGGEDCVLREKKSTFRSFRPSVRPQRTFRTCFGREERLCDSATGCNEGGYKMIYIFFSLQ